MRAGEVELGTADLAGAVKRDVLDTEEVVAVLHAGGDLDCYFGGAWGVVSVCIPR